MNHSYPNLDSLRLPPGREHARADLIRVLDALVEDFGASRIVAFGSCAHGSPDEHSDVDLLVVSGSHLTASDRPTCDANEAAARIRARIPMEILVRSPGQWEAARAKPFGVTGDAVMHGVTLYER